MRILFRTETRCFHLGGGISFTHPALSSALPRPILAHLHQKEPNDKTSASMKSKFYIETVLLRQI